MDSWNTSFLLGLPIFSGFCYWFHGVYVWKKQLGRRSLNDRTAKVSTSPKGKHLPWKEGLRMVLLRVLINHVQCRIKIEHPKAECGSWTCSPGQGNLFWKPSFSASSGSCRAFKKKHHATSWDSVHFPCISLKFVVMTFPFPKQWCSLFSLPPQKKNKNIQLNVWELKTDLRIWKNQVSQMVAENDRNPKRPKDHTEATFEIFFFSCWIHHWLRVGRGPTPVGFHTNRPGRPAHGLQTVSENARPPWGHNTYIIVGARQAFSFFFGYRTLGVFENLA